MPFIAVALNCESGFDWPGAFHRRLHTPPKVAALLFWQMTDLLHLWNYTRPFIVNLKPDEVLGDHR
jgi:hypothetical protein